MEKEPTKLYARTLFNRRPVQFRRKQKKDSCYIAPKSAPSLFSVATIEEIGVSSQPTKLSNVAQIWGFCDVIFIPDKRHDYSYNYNNYGMITIIL